MASKPFVFDNIRTDASATPGEVSTVVIAGPVSIAELGASQVALALEPETGDTAGVVFTPQVSSDGVNWYDITSNLSAEGQTIAIGASLPNINVSGSTWIRAKRTTASATKGTCRVTFTARSALNFFDTDPRLNAGVGVVIPGMSRTGSQVPPPPIGTGGSPGYFY